MAIDLSRDPESVEDLERQLLDCLPYDGTLVGNIAIMRKLEWDDEKYWMVRDRLIDRGVLEKGRGQGGSVRMSQYVPETVVTEPAESSHRRLTELELYQPMARVLKEEWAKDKRLDQIQVEVTALQGGRQTGGRWTRPDVTIASYSTYLYLPQKYFDVITFEIKRHDAFDVTAVYEAVAHRRAATRSYILLWVPEECKGDCEAALEQTRYEARQHGIGVIVAREPGNYETWDEIEDAIRRDPDPDNLNEFIQKQMSQQFKDTLLRWFR